MAKRILLEYEAIPTEHEGNKWTKIYVLSITLLTQKGKKISGKMEQQ